MDSSHKSPNACYKCHGKANTRVNNLSYCSGCFQKIFENKIGKNLTKIFPKDTIMIKCDNQLYVTVLIRILKIIFGGRSGPNIYLDDGVAVNNITSCILQNDPTANNILQNDPAANSKGHSNLDIKTVIYCASLEEVLANSLKQLCYGKGKEAINGDPSGIMDLNNAASIGDAASNNKSVVANDSANSLVNVFKDVKMKEISYYAYLNRIGTENAVNKKDKLLKTLLDFFLEEGDRNGLVLFNVMNVLKKLGKQASG